MIIIFQIFLFSKEFPACLAMSVLSYLAKLKRDLGLTFGAYFLHDFSIKCSVFNTLSMDQVSMSHFISFSRYQTKRVIEFLLRQ